MQVAKIYLKSSILLKAAASVTIPDGINGITLAWKIKKVALFPSLSEIFSKILYLENLF